MRCTALAPGCNLVEVGGVKNHRLTLFAAAASVFLAAPLARAESSGWLSNYQKAQQEAKANNKFLLLDFTGSDWCGWCKKFDREILSQSQFKDYARENLVLVELDFPRSKPQSTELREIAQRLNAHRLFAVTRKSTVIFVSLPSSVAASCVTGRLC